MPLPTLVVTHGRDQRWQIGTTMQREWAEALRFGLKRAQAPYWDTIEVRFAFYGDLWRDDLEAERSDDVTPIQDEVARELLARGGGASALADAAEERSLFSTLAKLAGFVDEHVGIGGDIVLQLFLKDLAEYFRDTERRGEANSVVAAEVSAASGDVILLGHSMGTIVSYLSLFEKQAALQRVRGLLTFGSPLGMDSMRRQVGAIVPGLPFPAQPLRWVNVFNDEDFATMVPRLADFYRSTDGRVVEDVAALGKPPSVGDPGRGHDPLIYLSSRGLATQLRSLIDGGSPDDGERGAPPWIDEDVDLEAVDGRGDGGDRGVAMANGGDGGHGDGGHGGVALDGDAGERGPEAIPGARPDFAADDGPLTRTVDVAELERLSRDRGDDLTTAEPPGEPADPRRLPPVERTMSADFPPVVAPGSEHDLLIAIARQAVFGGGSTGFSIERPQGETTVDLRIGVYAPDFDVSLETGEAVAVTAITLDLEAPDQRIDRRFRLRAAKLEEPKESSIWLSVSRGTLPIGQMELRTRIDPTYVAPKGEIKLTFTSAPDPDIVLIVSDLSEDTVGKGPFDLRVSREGQFVDLAIGRWKVTADAWSAARDILEKYRQVNKEKSPAEKIAKATAIGVELWWQLPDGFHEFYWDELSGGSARSIAVYSQEPYIPWELIVPQRQRGGPTEQMLGIQYSIARWKTGRHFPDPLVVSGMSVIAPEYEVSALPEAAKEAQDLIATYGARPAKGEKSVVTELLRTAGTQLIHFAGHGAYDPANVDDSEIRLSDGALNPNDLFSASIGQSDRPFVFLNACQVGETGWDLTQIGGWAEAFCAVGFTGFVGPYWKVNDLVARKAARVFYGSLRLGQTVGEAMQSVRARFLDDDEYKGHPSWLAYSLHSHPNIHIKLPGG